TGRDDETLALKALQAGAQDYLVKGQVFGTMLARSVRHAIERVRTEQSLREAEERFRELADHVSSVYWLASGDGGEVLFLNPAFERVTGRSREAVYADPYSALQIVHPEDRPLLERRLAAGPGAWDDEYRIVRPCGEVRWVRDRGRPVRDAAGRTVRLAGLVEDVTDTRLAQEQIRLQAHLLDAVGESVIATHLDGTVFYWNRAAERLYGWSAAEAVGRSIMELTVPEISREEGERIMARLAVGECWHGEFLVRRRDGTTFPALVSDAPILDPAGRLIGIIGTSSDVSARKRAEEALRDSEARYRTLFETMAQGVVFMDDRGRVRSANPAALEILGLSRDEILELSADHPRMRMLDEDGSPLPRGECPGTMALRTGQVAERMVGVHNPVQQRCRWLLVHARPQRASGDAAPCGAYVTFTDITAQREAEAAQRGARQKLDAILRTTPLATIVVDRGGKVLMWNPAAERMFGWTADEVVGHPYPLVPADGAPAPHAIFEDAYDGIVWNGQEVRRRTRDGRVLDLCLWNAGLSGGDGEPVGLVGVFADVTERKALEAQFLQSQKMEAVGRLAGGVAHDFNNLLTAITGHTGLLLENAVEGSEQHDDLMEIRRAAERAASLTGQLLAFSRKQVLRPRVLDLNAVVGDTEAMLRRLIGEDVEMVIQCRARIPTIRADRGQVEQVLVNLVVNARDAMPTGGRLTIATDAVVITPENAQEHPYDVRPGPYVRVTVSDTGVGMPPEVAS
ncbi:MAG TPA: PAS domain S-box protein, partial [Longimicrobium sp.]